jgi:hypothetical protein
VLVGSSWQLAQPVPRNIQVTVVAAFTATAPFKSAAIRFGPTIEPGIVNRASQRVDRGFLNEDRQVGSLYNGEIAMLRRVADGASTKSAMIRRNFESRIVDSLLPTNSIGVEFHFVIVAGAQGFQLMTDCAGC